MHSYDIGEVVDVSEIVHMNSFIKSFGEQAFSSAVYFGAFANCVSAYLHPCDEMKETENFKMIQKAFINAYV